MGRPSATAGVRAYGRREKVTFGTNKEGWNRTRAELETEKILQQIERGTWVPARLEPRADRLQDAMAELGVQMDETYGPSPRPGGDRSSCESTTAQSATTGGDWATWSASSAVTV